MWVLFASGKKTQRKSQIRCGKTLLVETSRGITVRGMRRSAGLGQRRQGKQRRKWLKLKLKRGDLVLARKQVDFGGGCGTGRVGFYE